MNSIVADIYVVLSVTTIILFILTRKTSIRVINRNQDFIFSIGFSLFKIELLKKENDIGEVKLPNADNESGISTDFEEIFSLLSLLFHYFQKCSITIRYFAIPTNAAHGSIYMRFGFLALISTVIAYIESNVEKLIIYDNAFILSSDGKTEFDIDLKITLFNLLVLIIRLILKCIKIERLEKANVGN